MTSVVIIIIICQCPLKITFLISYQENNKKLAYDQFLVEKKMIDDLVETIKAEDAQRREDEREQIRKHREFIGNKEKDDKQREMELQQWQEDQETVLEIERN